MKIFLTRDFSKKEKQFPEGTKIEEVLKAEGASKQTIVILLNGGVAHPSTVLREGDELELVGVIYGG